MKAILMLSILAISSLGFAQTTWVTQKITFDLNLTLVNGPQPADKVVVSAGNVAVTAVYGVNGDCSVEYQSEKFNCHTRFVDWNTSGVCEDACGHQLLTDVVLPPSLLYKILAQSQSVSWKQFIQGHYEKIPVEYYLSENSFENDVIFLSGTNQNMSIEDNQTSESLSIEYKVTSYESSRQ